MNRRTLLATATLSSLALAGLAQDRVNDPTSFIWNPALSPTGTVLSG
jgi:hypothetical protein